MGITYRVFESDYEFLIKYYTEKVLEEGVEYNNGEEFRYELIESNLPSDITVYQALDGTEDSFGLALVDLFAGTVNTTSNYLLVGDNKLIIIYIDSYNDRKEIMEGIYEQLFKD